MQRFASGKSPAPSAIVTNYPKTTEQPAITEPAIPSIEHLLAEFERSTELQHESVNFTDFAAFKRADARGAFRLLRRVA